MPGTIEDVSTQAIPKASNHMEEQKQEGAHQDLKIDISKISHPKSHRDHHHPYHHRMSPTRRPLTTHTTLGSPINSRIRSNSLGTTPIGWHSPAPYSPSLCPYSARSVPVSPMVGYSGTSLMASAPQVPNLPPEPSETQRAMDAAAASERARAKKLEEEEADMSADELRAVLKRERHRTGRIAADLAALKSASVQSQLEAEVIEEGRINGLMRRLDDVQQEKGRIIVELEREEEMLTNTLQKKLNEVRREKSLLEQQIEREKKAHIVLQHQLSDLRNNHLSVAEALEEEDEMEEED